MVRAFQHNLRPLRPFKSEEGRGLAIVAVDTVAGRGVSFRFRYKGEGIVANCFFFAKVNPDDIVVDGWDINSANLAEAVERAQVLEPALQQQLKSQLAVMKPRASIYDPDFIAANQADRANNVIKGTKAEQVRKKNSHLTKPTIETSNSMKHCFLSLFLLYSLHKTGFCT